MSELDTIKSQVKKLKNVIEEQQRVNSKRYRRLSDDFNLLSAKLRWLETYCHKEIKETEEELR